ncbi:MAG TPA: phosphate-starvation-inducible PsiE family protein [Acidiferrobacterales bacterium]|nr:phosphate-starvation-inducible PsiE family protein [Acidiferrobacterales bacterium]
MTRPVSRYAGLTLRAAEDIGLAVIGLATIVAGWQEVQAMLTAGKVSLADLLLMFIYLEVLTMVGLYFESGKLPVRFPLYIGMVALARYLILDMKDLDVWRMLGVALSIVLLAAAVLAIRYGHVRYPYLEDGTSTRHAGSRNKR